MAIGKVAVMVEVGVGISAVVVLAPVKMEGVAVN